MFGNYSKLIGSLIGSVIAIVVAYAATKGLGTCVTPVTPPGAAEVCTIAGFTSAQITGSVITGLSAIFVYAFPRNQP